MPQSSLRSISNDYARLNGSDYGHRTAPRDRGRERRPRVLARIKPLSTWCNPAHRCIGDYHADRVSARLPRRPSQDRWHSTARRAFRAGMKLIARNHGPIMNRAVRECERLRSRGLNEESGCASEKNRGLRRLYLDDAARWEKFYTYKCEIYYPIIFFQLLNFPKDYIHSQL